MIKFGSILSLVSCKKDISSLGYLSIQFVLPANVAVAHSQCRIWATVQLCVAGSTNWNLSILRITTSNSDTERRTTFIISGKLEWESFRKEPLAAVNVRGVRYLIFRKIGLLTFHKYWLPIGFYCHCLYGWVATED